jgi:predicted DCC family thiol-disulfide oxidoreductase YuxK
MTDRAEEIEVYYDGSCPLCVAEINHYKRLDRDGQVTFTDVSQAGEKIACDLTKKEAMARFHIRENGNAVLAGAPAFVALWKRLPGWSRLANIMAFPYLVVFADWMYSGFLFFRPLLVRIYVLFRNSPMCSRREG